MRRKLTDEEREYRHWDEKVRAGVRRLDTLQKRYSAAQRALQNATSHVLYLKKKIAEAEKEVNAAEYERESAGAYLTGES